MNHFYQMWFNVLYLTFLYCLGRFSLPWPSRRWRRRIARRAFYKRKLVKIETDYLNVYDYWKETESDLQEVEFDLRIANARVQNLEEQQVHDRTKIDQQAALILTLRSQLAARGRELARHKVRLP